MHKLRSSLCPREDVMLRRRSPWVKINFPSSNGSHPLQRVLFIAFGTHSAFNEPCGVSGKTFRSFSISDNRTAAASRITVQNLQHKRNFSVKVFPRDYSVHYVITTLACNIHNHTHEKATGGQVGWCHFQEIKLSFSLVNEPRALGK